jgi:hypothetical protein
MKRWELSAHIRVLAPAVPGKPGIVEANLQSLARDFGACLAIPLLYGKDFLNRCPRLIEDFWKFDNDLFPLLMIGMPEWLPFKMMQEALYRRIDQNQRGEPIDFVVDMSDVPFERNKIYERERWSFAERAVADFAIFWGQMPIRTLCFSGSWPMFIRRPASWIEYERKQRHTWPCPGRSPWK